MSLIPKVEQFSKDRSKVTVLYRDELIVAPWRCGLYNGGIITAELNNKSIPIIFFVYFFYFFFYLLYFSQSHVLSHSCIAAITIFLHSEQFSEVTNANLGNVMLHFSNDKCNIVIKLSFDDIVNSLKLIYLMIVIVVISVLYLSIYFLFELRN